ncbi:hypothetical protein QN277_006412 [Acacia crassicarpa]|uniref:Uncharacterized protein n=1 Tax=Acacia crassicarpa TaxID=499986 RepID=A0AAE1ISZ0_9FABA|nr:hypothetical protein QN277_006412 [Acacia crassicarpa]
MWRRELAIGTLQTTRSVERRSSIPTLIGCLVFTFMPSNENRISSGNSEKFCFFYANMAKRRARRTVRGIEPVPESNGTSSGDP